MANEQRRGHLYREAGTLPRVVRIIDFDLLPADVQRRMHQALVGQGVPELLAKEPRDDRLLLLNSPVRCYLVALGAVLLEGYLWFSHFGDLYSEGQSIQPPVYALYHGAALSLLIASILALTYGNSAAPSLPRGKYLFPQDLVDVKGRWLVFTSLETLRDVEIANAAGPTIALRFADGGWEHLRLDAKTNVANFADRVRKAIDEAQPHPNDSIVASYGAEVKRAVPKDARPRLALAAIVLASALGGASCGHSVWERHNELSDEATFDHVRALVYAQGDEFEQAAQQYEKISLRHRDDLERFRYERSKGNVQAGLAYLRWSKKRRVKTNQNDAHEKDVDDRVFRSLQRMGDPAQLVEEYIEIGGDHVEALRERVGVLSNSQWKAAAERNSVKAFAELRRNAPNTALDRQAQVEIHERYQKLRNECMTHWWGNLQMKLVVWALLDALDERHDPQVIVEIRAIEPTKLAEADAKLAQSNGIAYQPAAPHFSPERVEAQLSEAMQKHVQSALHGFFANDIDFVADAHDPTLPRIVVELSIEAATNEVYVIPKRAERLARVQLHSLLRLEVQGKSPQIGMDKTSQPEPQETFDMYAETYPQAQHAPLSPWIEQMYWRIVGNAADELAAALQKAM